MEEVKGKNPFGTPIIATNGEVICRTIQSNNNEVTVNFKPHKNGIRMEIVTPKIKKGMVVIDISQEEANYLFKDLATLEPNETLQGNIQIIMRRLERQEKRVNNGDLKEIISKAIQNCYSWQKDKKFSVTIEKIVNAQIKINVTINNLKETFILNYDYDKISNTEYEKTERFEALIKGALYVKMKKLQSTGKESREEIEAELKKALDYVINNISRRAVRSGGKER